LSSIDIECCYRPINYTPESGSSQERARTCKTKDGAKGGRGSSDDTGSVGRLDEGGFGGGETTENRRPEGDRVLVLTCSLLSWRYVQYVMLKAYQQAHIGVPF
jgi:hypothetical protein